MKACAACGWTNLPHAPRLNRNYLRVIDPGGGADMCSLCAGAALLRATGRDDLTLVIGMPVAELAR